MRQKDTSQIKEQGKITARDLREMEISNMPDREFKIIERYSLNLIVEDISETLNKEKKNQSEMKNTINEIKNTLDRINGGSRRTYPLRTE